MIHEFGGPERLGVEDVATPGAGPGEVRVRVRASSANPVDAIIREGTANPDLPLPAILGSDVAGVIDEVGAGVAEFARGDDVYYTADLADGGGAYAEFHVTPASIVARMPRTLAYLEAAAIPLAGGTAWEAIIRRLDVRPGEIVLVHGGSGGVGSFAIQFARAAGARVLATAGPDNQQMVRDLGAAPIDYKNTDFVEAARDATGGTGVDAVFDTVGGNNVVRSLAATRAGGRVATILAPEGRLDDLYLRNQVLHGIFLTRERARLADMTPLFERGQAKPVVAQVHKLDDIVRVHEQLGSGHSRGKHVISIE